MTDQPPPPADLPRPWWKRGWGIAYLALLGIASAATVFLVAMPVKDGKAGHDASLIKAIGLGWTVGALDVLLAIGIGIGVFRRRFWRAATPAVNLLLGLALFALSTAAVVIFFFFACLAVID
jgi:hypothetical protein